MQKLQIIYLIISCSMLNLWAAESSYQGGLKTGDAFLLSAHKGNKVVLYSQSKQLLWENKSHLAHPQQVEALDDGTVLVGTQDGAQLLDHQGYSLWHHKIPKGFQNSIAHKIAADRFLIGHEGAAKLIEINRAGETLWTLPLQGANPKVHGQYRYCSVTPEGSYLVPLLTSKKLHEYNRDGKLLMSIENLNQVTCAKRLANGNTLVSLRGAIREYDKSGEIIWEFDIVKEGQLKSCPVTSFQLLANGNLILALYHKDPKQANLIEINRAKEIVARWSFPQYGMVAFIDIVDASNPLIKNQIPLNKAE